MSIPKIYFRTYFFLKYRRFIGSSAASAGAGLAYLSLGKKKDEED